MCVFDCAGSHRTVVPVLGRGLFSWKFSRDMALVACPRAFRLRRLTQSAWLALAVPHVSWQAQYLAGPCMILCRSFNIPLYKVLAWSWTGPSEDLAEILVGSSPRGPCMKILQMPCLIGACMTALVGGSWGVLVFRSCKIRSSNSSRSFFWRPCEILLGALPCRSLSKMVKVFYKSLWEDLVSIPVKCCQGLLHDLVQVLVGSSWRVLVKSSGALGVLTLDMIWYRSLWEGLVEILLKSSLRCPCIKILKMLCVGAVPLFRSI